jgi:hypothetical protein
MPRTDYPQAEGRSLRREGAKLPCTALSRARLWKGVQGLEVDCIEVVSVLHAQQEYP